MLLRGKTRNKKEEKQERREELTEVFKTRFGWDTTEVLRRVLRRNISNNREIREEINKMGRYDLSWKIQDSTYLFGVAKILEATESRYLRALEQNRKLMGQRDRALHQLKVLKGKTNE